MGYEDLNPIVGFNSVFLDVLCYKNGNVSHRNCSYHLGARMKKHMWNRSHSVSVAYPLPWAEPLLFYSLITFTI
jgi:hypothetical protein